MFKLLLLTLCVALAASSTIDRPSSQAMSPKVCVEKLGEKPDAKCACKLWIKGAVSPPEYYLKWTCPNQDPKKPMPTAPASASLGGASTTQMKSTTPQLKSTPTQSTKLFEATTKKK